METIYADGNLTFVGQDCECIPPWLSRKYGDVTKRMDLSYNRLRSLKGLVGFNFLEELLLDNNQLKDDIEFPNMPTLRTLTINKNRLDSLEHVLDSIASKLPNLAYLSLLGNAACPNQLISMDKDDEDYQRYRHYVLYRLPSLRFLDSTPVKDEERKESMRIGAYTKVVSSQERKYESASDTDSQDENYTPLPTTLAEEGNHKATFGTCRYVYYGKHSEGNRFIANNDL